MHKLQKLSDLSGRRVLITGAAGALGRVIVETMAELSADLVLVDHPSADMSALAEHLSTMQIRVQTIACDLEDTDSRQQCVTAVLAENKALSVLINNAAFVGTSGLQGWAEPFEKQSVETWRRALEVNLTAAFDLCQQLAPALARSGHGNIINVGSIYGVLGPNWALYEDTPMSNPAAYGATKGGIIQLTRWLATTLGPNIRVNAVSPGGIARGQPESFVEKYEAATPLKRMATEDDFRGIFAYLSSDLSAYVTGQNILVDGGWSSW